MPSINQRFKQRKEQTTIYSKNISNGTFGITKEKEAQNNKREMISHDKVEMRDKGYSKKKRDEC